LDSQLDRIKDRMCAEIDLLIGKNTEHAKALLEEIRAEILDNIRPLRFDENSPYSVIHKRAESFEKLCFRLRQNSINEPDKLSTYSFYKNIEIINENNLKKKNNG